MVTCQNCGGVNPDSNRFCRMCGRRLERSAAEGEFSTLPPNHPSRAQAASFVRRSILGVAFPIPFLLPLPLFAAFRNAFVAGRSRLGVAIGLVFWLMVWGTLVGDFANFHPGAGLVAPEPERKMARLGSALAAYKRLHGRFPAHLKDLVEAGLLDASALECRLRGKGACPPMGKSAPEQMWGASKRSGEGPMFYRPEVDPDWEKDLARFGDNCWMVVCSRQTGVPGPKADEVAPGGT